MTYSQALREAKKLRSHILAAGVERCSIELVSGRGSAGYYSGTHLATMGHHIVSRRSQGNTPFLWLVKKGRADLPGPLCNVYGGFDRVARIICMGYANHSGRGGPYRVESGTIPRNNGRPYFMGFEFEGGLRAADWTDADHEFQARTIAGTHSYLSEARGRTITERSHIEHKTWAPGRKSDRLGYTLDLARDLIERYGGEEMVSRSSKADDGLEIFADHVRKARELGHATEHTQPGGVAFNDEILAILDRAGLLDYERTIKKLQRDIAEAHKEIATLKRSGGGGSGLAPGTTFEAEIT